MHKYTALNQAYSMYPDKIAQNGTKQAAAALTVMAIIGESLDYGWFGICVKVPERGSATNEPTLFFL